MTSASGEAAGQLAGLGYYIFPIARDSKVPVLRWSMESTCNPQKVQRWWRDWPEDNIGIDTGRSGLLVVDLDNSQAAMAFMEKWDRHQAQDPALVIQTPRGWHLYFENLDYNPLRNTQNRLGEGIDTRGAGGMVIAPGSKVAGMPYQVLSGSLGDVPPLPGWLATYLKPRPQTIAQQREAERRRWFKPSQFQAERALTQWCRKIASAPQGQQNNRINLAAFILARDFCPPLDIEDVRHKLELAAEEGNHPRRRAEPTIASGLRGSR